MSIFAFDNENRTLVLGSSMESKEDIYELINFTVIQRCELPDNDILWLAGEELPLKMDKGSEYIECDANGIPMGKTIAEIKLRKQIIFQFYEKWKNEHSDKSVYNKNLNAKILIRKESVVEASEHSSKRYESTLAVLKLDTILSEAVKIAEDKPKKDNKNQKKFIKMILMSYTSPDNEIVKLTVGLRRRTKEKIQYGITVVQEKGDKKKASPKK